MRISVALAVIALVATVGALSAHAGENAAIFSIAALNDRIEVAIGEGAEWPKTPGGLAGKLFGIRSMVLPREPRTGSHIVFPGSHFDQAMTDEWFEATIEREPDKTWRIWSINQCGEMRAAEAELELDNRRKRFKKWCGFDYVSEGPLDLLEILKSRDKPTMLPPGIPSCWISESDLPALFNLLDSNEPCAGVINMLSSRIDTSHSTVGNQAAYLIEGFRKGRYPPGLLTTEPYRGMKELKSWWRDRGGT